MLSKSGNDERMVEFLKPFFWKVIVASLMKTTVFTRYKGQNMWRQGADRLVLEGQRRALNGIHPHVIKIMTDTLLKSLKEARAPF